MVPSEYITSGDYDMGKIFLVHYLSRKMNLQALKRLDLLASGQNGKRLRNRSLSLITRLGSSYLLLTSRR